MKTNKTKCPSCGEQTETVNMTQYNGEVMCEGCAESSDFCSDLDNDITGRDFSDNCE